MKNKKIIGVEMENTNKLTGKKISEEMITILEKLKENETVDLDEINKSPEIIEAYEKCDSRTATNELPGREEIRKKALEELTLQQSYVKETGMLNGFINKDKRVDIVIGLPAAGKSSALVEPISNNYKSRIIDADEAKKLIPEYNEGWGSSRVHRESKLIIGELINNSIKNNENIVIPVVGSKYQEVEKNINIFKEAGYKVYIHYNDLLPNKALGRMINRFLETGRFLEPNLILKYDNKPQKVFEEIIKTNKIDGYSSWNNDVPKGAEPILIKTNIQNPLNKKNDIENITIDDSIIKDIKSAGFNPTSTLIKNIQDYQNMTKTKFKLFDATVIYKNADVLNEKSLGKMKEIGNELKAQEMIKIQNLNQNQER